MSKRFSKFIQLGIVAVWFCLVSVLVYRHYISGVEFTALQSVSGDQFKTSDEWFSIYLQERKIGHMHISTEKIGDEYRFIQSVETDTDTDGTKRHSSTLFKFLTDPDYRMKTFEFETQTEGNVLKARGELDEKNMLLVFMEGGGQKKTHTQEIHGQIYPLLAVKQILSGQGLEKGKRFKFPVFNVMTMKSEEIAAEVQELMPIKLGINVGTVYKLKIGGFLTWITERVSTLKEIDPSGLVFFTSTETRAKSKENDPIFDFLSLPVQQSKNQLSNPGDLSSLEVRLSGLNLSDYPLLDEGRQVLEGGLIKISKEKIEAMKEMSYDLPYQGKDLEAFIAPTRFVQSDHHTIIYNAKKFVTIEKNAFRLARFLVSNLYLTISKSPVFHLATSMDVFKTPSGESNEHTVMFTAFARAGGLPTRMVGGLVYVKGYFYYHTWPEVWLQQWVPVDPTMGQFPADVTHIRLMEGDIDELASLGEIMGNIKIDIMGAL